MVNNKFYEGFEGEAELSFIAKDDKLVIWNGYFETILDNLLDSNLEKKGILKEYFNFEGWYDESPWFLEDVSLAINQLKSFDISKVRESSMKETLEIIVETITSFLEKNSTSEIYIQYE